MSDKKTAIHKFNQNWISIVKSSPDKHDKRSILQWEKNTPSNNQMQNRRFSEVPENYNLFIEIQRTMNSLILFETSHTHRMWFARCSLFLLSPAARRLIMYVFGWTHHLNLDSDHANWTFIFNIILIFFVWL